MQICSPLSPRDKISINANKMLILVIHLQYYGMLYIHQRKYNLIPVLRTVVQI